MTSNHLWMHAYIHISVMFYLSKGQQGISCNAFVCKVYSHGRECDNKVMALFPNFEVKNLQYIP